MMPNEFLFRKIFRLFCALLNQNEKQFQMFRKILVSLLLVLPFQFLFAQSGMQNWFLLNPATDGFNGVACNAAYDQLLKGKTGTDVIVAVIDGGVDVSHPDLSANIWTNKNEIPDNGIDDDHNGYIDDIHGWDFIGGKDGTDVNQDNYELTRLYRELKKKYEFGNTTGDKTEYDYFLKLQTEYNAKKADAQSNLDFYTGFTESIEQVIHDIGKSPLTYEDLQNYQTTDNKLLLAKIYMMAIGKSNGTDDYATVLDEFKEGKDQYYSMVNYGYNLDFDPRNIVGDDYSDATQKGYGNNEVKGPDGMHGTHVSGIIGAVRDNGIGMDGVAKHVKIMAVRCVPDGDERDKDVANAIRYAVDNGAKVINMSFGKGYAYNKADVDDAVKYAMSKDVLLVHGAGNDAESNDNTDNFPNDHYADGGYAAGWIEVGASQPDGTAASFSNYGKVNVDLFSPGTEIYSTIPDGKYKYLQGTSMASPVCAGVAALIRSYFPSLTNAQVKEVLLNSVYKPAGKTPIPGQKKKKASMKKLCVSGGIVNAYNAVLLAESMTK